MQVERVAAAYEACALHEAAEGSMAVAVRANKFVDDAAPWTAFKKVSLHAVRLDIMQLGVPGSHDQIP